MGMGGRHSFCVLALLCLACNEVRLGDDAEAAFRTKAGARPVTLSLQQGVGDYTGTVDTTLSSVDWTWVPESRGSFGGSERLRVLERDGRHALLRFDLRALPAGAHVVSARLRLFVERVDFPVSPALDLHRLEEEWIEGRCATQYACAPDGATWRSRGPGRASWRRAGGTYGERVATGAIAAGRAAEFDVTGVVAEWVAGARPNHGLLLRGTRDGVNDVSIASSEARDAARRPRLEIAWLPAEAAPPPASAPRPVASAPPPPVTAPRPVASAPPPVASAPPPVASAPPPVAPADFCPPYPQSPLYRPRARQIVVGPADDWKRTIETAAPGTEVLLRDGEYRLGETYAVRIRRDVTVRGQRGDRARVVIRGAGYGVWSEGLQILGPNVTIASLTITQVRDHAVSIKGETGAQAPHLYDLHLVDIGTQHVKLTPGGMAGGVVACSSIGFSPGGVRGDYIDGVDLHGAIDWVIRDNEFYNITGDGSGCAVDVSCGTYISGPAVLVWNGARGTVIERNVFVDNFRNIALGLGRGHTGGVIRNNFIWRAGPGDAGIELQTADGALVAHNTVRVGGYPAAIEVRDARGVRLVGNALGSPVWNRGNAVFEARGNVERVTDADFAAPGDYHLSARSACRGAGIALAEVPADIEGETRGARPDVGADQSPR